MQSTVPASAYRSMLNFNKAGTIRFQAVSQIFGTANNCETQLFRIIIKFLLLTFQHTMRSGTDFKRSFCKSFAGICAAFCDPCARPSM